MKQIRSLKIMAVTRLFCTSENATLVRLNERIGGPVVVEIIG